ncbi:MAG: sugar phosphate isomerase/epimerase [Marinilabiliales bacterium]|nr:MAG: sugar phosphate isomerase/epimerase [Marinilabiliales bacterium]
MDRRSFIQKSIAAAVIAGLPSTVLASCSNPGPAGIGICDWNLGRSADPSYIPRAAGVGLEAIQVSVGTSPGNMPLREKAVREKYLDLGKQHGIVFPSVAAGSILNEIPLATEPQSAIFVVDALEAAAALGSTNILTAFFGNGDLLERDESGSYINISTGKFPEYKWKEKDVERVIAVIKQIVPRAEDLGVVIGLENTLTARQNLQIIDEIGSSMVQIYYDTANPWNNGYDVPGEIRMIGNHRMCEIHLKNTRWNQNLFDETGEVDLEACAAALRDIGYDKWLILETSGRENRFEEDTKANIEFARKVFM